MKTAGCHDEDRIGLLSRKIEVGLPNPTFMSTPTPKSFLSDDVSANADGRPWTRDELRSSVDEYLKMLESERAGQSYIKKAVYKKLAAQFNRTAKAFEYRMQNISYVLALMGRQWLPGLKPAKNVGSNGALIEQFINELEQRSTVPTVKFELDVRDALKKPQIVPPPGNASPEATRATVTQIRRDPSVKAWVLAQANGTCECCSRPAPFKGADGLPYLEVHHVRKLAERGPDLVSNTVAVCPNCHRELHYGESARQLVERLYARLPRLVRA
ncbi:HNH endonuclease [Burkholderia cenocepacia]|jgi:5-methylcytosine-specific restriction protein A|uniref:HNH endonuclease n=1 Tax=Burkholderia cenocepacia TaxID=95486 RepID=UPI001E2EB2A7|nr:HNH endonuclease [Burkholderia cenocepacia]MCG0582325.1 HNH endonuclease [Burkholderia cenocepacia]MCO1393178.1 HNH endonuclease [Burkholderia cenocepacia]MCO1406005.1 HNH endonuclease [Burkholderia cenocepacia]MCW5126984.1 HNH endonuclease [Burkholderia cenocepacia]MDN7639652.1 HNH endonuclease [Burkholderia cenocepacia]